MKQFTIVGGGFGLYGYLPALLKSGNQVVLPEKYRVILTDRQELCDYIPSIHWVADRAASLARAEGVAIACPPDFQHDIVRECFSYGIKKIFLEKPLQPTPMASDNLLRELKEAGIRFRVGYLFVYMSWAQNLRSYLFKGPQEENNKKSVSITWLFTAHHIRHGLQSWKADMNHGGGIIKFYGIHLLSLLANFGYTTVEDSYIYGADINKPHKWSARFNGAGLVECNILVNAHASVPGFRIDLMRSGSEITFLNLTEPFAAESVEMGQDLRVAPLLGMIQELESANHLVDAAFYTFCQATNALWRNVEEKSRFCASPS